MSVSDRLMTADPNARSGPGLGGIDHVSLSVRNLERSRRWYCVVLGFRVERDIEGDGFSRAILQHQDLRVVFGLTHHHANPGTPSSHAHTGLDHLAFTVGSLDELGLWRAELDRHAVAYSAPRTNLLVLRDPDGIQLELYVA